jgi:hypothetical protein
MQNLNKKDMKVEGGYLGRGSGPVKGVKVDKREIREG